MLDETHFSPYGLRALHFQGFVSIARLRRTDLADVPTVPGVYAVLRSDLAPPVFLSVSSGGRWRGKNPNVPLESLHSAWVSDAFVLYFGKAKALRDRLALYLDFGAGQDVMHYGGRYIWHLDRTDLLDVAWVTTDPPNGPSDPPRDLERLLIQGFRQVYGVLPFANLQE